MPTKDFVADYFLTKGPKQDQWRREMWFQNIPANPAMGVAAHRRRISTKDAYNWLRRGATEVVFDDIKKPWVPVPNYYETAK